MVTNLDFLQVGGLYPPATEIPRLYKYKRYDAIFNSNLAEAYNFFLKNPTTGVPATELQNQMQTIFTNPRIMNYGRAITKKVVDLAISRKPSLTCDTDQGDLDLLEIQRKTNCWKKVKLALIDTSRYGNGYARVYNMKDRVLTDNGTLTDGEAGCNVIKPELTTIVVDSLDKEHILHYIIGWVDEVTEYSVTNPYQVDQKETKFYLTLEIHSKGYYEYRRYKVSDPVLNLGAIKQYRIEEDVTPEKYKGKKIKTGLDDCFAIKPFIGFTTSDDPLYGLSDYDMFDSLMIDLCERVSQLSEVFEKHGNPSMQGSEKLMSTDENGNPVFYTGDFYPLQPGEQPLQYITWDAKSKDILEYCNNILQQIFILSEMGDGSIMGYTDKSNGFAESGKAMRMRMASPLMKVQSLLSDNEDTIIDMVHDFSVIMGKNIDREKIEVEWHDGLPVDYVEETNNFNARVTNGTESVVYGLQRRFHMTPEQANEEFNQIIKEKKRLKKAEETQQNTQNNENVYKNTLQSNNPSDNIKSETREQVENRLDAVNSQR